VRESGLAGSIPETLSEFPSLKVLFVAQLMGALSPVAGSGFFLPFFFLNLRTFSSSLRAYPPLSSSLSVLWPFFRNLAGNRLTGDIPEIWDQFENLAAL
jgi:hypothetical protein